MDSGRALVVKDNGTALPATETESESFEDPITDDLLGDTFEDELDALLSAPDPEDAEL